MYYFGVSINFSRNKSIKKNIYYSKIKITLTFKNSFSLIFNSLKLV